VESLTEAAVRKEGILATAQTSCAAAGYLIVTTAGAIAVGSCVVTYRVGRVERVPTDSDQAAHTRRLVLLSGVRIKEKPIYFIQFDTRVP